MNDNISMNQVSQFWRQKLSAFLHDTPSKCLDIRNHGEFSREAHIRAGLINNDQQKADYDRRADTTAASADRLPWPDPRAASMSCVFDGERNAFRHPMGNFKNKPSPQIPFTPFKSVEQSLEGEGSTQPLIDHFPKSWDEVQRWRARFFAHWRLWLRNAVDTDYRYAFLPADTRIPDHTIWNHMQVVSALAGCVDSNNNLSPAFFRFQIGGIQDFISEARSTRDLWSGSYLFSWLMATGLKCISEICGPDAVIFPNLRGQPIFDFLWRDEIWNEVRMHEKTDSCWEELKPDDHSLVIPNLPNVFLAVVPAAEISDIGSAITNAVICEWKHIAKSVWKNCEEANLTEDEGAIKKDERKERFDAQVNRSLDISWQGEPWPESIDKAVELVKHAPEGSPMNYARERSLAVINMAQEKMPKQHRDKRYYIDDQKKGSLNNIGIAWAVLLAHQAWLMDAVRRTRAFAATESGGGEGEGKIRGWHTGAGNNKDALNGREEAIAGGREWVDRCKKAGEPWMSLFKKEEWVGASTLIKRLWHHTYLVKEKGFFPKILKMPNTRGIAAHDPFAKEPKYEAHGTKEENDEEATEDKYFAVLAFDGDQIGKWVSGANNPSFSVQLADYWDGSKKQRQGSLEYFERQSSPDGKETLQKQFEDFLKSPRPLSPSYHLQFSEALSNFALKCVRPIIEAFHGRLIYAGGDDVLALLPSDMAIKCAQALRAAYQGNSELVGLLKETSAEGRFDICGKVPEENQKYPLSTGFIADYGPESGNSMGFKDDHGKGKPIPFMVPGPAMECSVGIAVAHYKHPLQDVVRSAQSAEKRAKQPTEDGGLGRAALAISLLKHSGDTIQWGSSWHSGGLEACNLLVSLMQNDVLSKRFPYRLIQLIEPYLARHSALQSNVDINSSDLLSTEEIKGIVHKELENVLENQKGSSYQKRDDPVLKQYQHTIDQYLGTLSKNQEKHTVDRVIQAVIGLHSSAAFICRQST